MQLKLPRKWECALSGLILSAVLLPISVGEERMAEGQLKRVVEKMQS